MRFIGHSTIVADFTGLADRGRLGHGYILFGPSMTGKATFARAFARYLEAGTLEVPDDATVLQDAKFIVPSGDSIGIDAVREIRNFLWQKPAASPRRTLVIDDADLMTTEAQNALLKVTEEPPASSLLIIVASDIDAILPTIASRLPRVHFGPVAEREIEAWLGGDEKTPKGKAQAAAKRAMGKPGLAYRLLHDKALEKNLDLAGRYLSSTAANRKDLVKKIIEPDDFSLRAFLDAVIMNLAWEKPSKARTALWHRALALYGSATNFGLNPRVQLEALLA
ncbi:MAG TPA: AAA family ATPase [Candidatus Paceibacterota bacterium]|nr:AAA family ATPase [Candidatus Paceibacterota bacterium]